MRKPSQLYLARMLVILLLAMFGAVIDDEETFSTLPSQNAGDPFASDVWGSNR